MPIKANDGDSREDTTPAIALEVEMSGIRRNLWLKLESHGPHGSLKDRTALALWRSVREQVDFAEGIIESTSGNLGISLAAICSRNGVPFTAVVDPRTSPAALDGIRRHGARIVMIDRSDGRGGYLLNRLAHVQEQLCARPRLVWTNQYGNPANPQAHRDGTAPELLRQVPERATVLVAVSTGGTLAGFLQFNRSHDLPWQVVGVDVEGSVALGNGVPGERILPGIGASRPSSFLSSEASVAREVVSAADAVGVCLWLADQTGIQVGGSSGAAIAAALRRLERGHDETDLAVICPDGGDRYVNTIYSASWRRANIPQCLQPRAWVTRQVRSVLSTRVGS
jgi:N-(2-amino-2-carboxyethyl)-L-glutamate synthase